MPKSCLPPQAPLLPPTWPHACPADFHAQDLPAAPGPLPGCPDRRDHAAAGAGEGAGQGGGGGGGHVGQASACFLAATGCLLEILKAQPC